MDKKKMAKKIKYALKFLPDKIYIQLYYFAKFKHFCNFKNPTTYNEKLQWLKINDRKDLYTKLVDKYEVKNYVADIIGEEYIIPTIGIYDNFDEIDFEKLPNQFVIKCTHDSEGIVLCKDKQKLNIQEAKHKIERCLKYNFYYIGREWPYKNIKSKILIEEYMEDREGKDLKDYKFFCFNGTPKAMFVASDRAKGRTKFDYYDLEFKHLDIIQHYPNSLEPIKKPKNFEKMIELSEKLSKGFNHVRIDFYEVEGRVYFGEITFYHFSGFQPFVPKKWDEIFGEWLSLNQMEHKGTGIKDKMIKRLNDLYSKLYKTIINYTYRYKELKNFKNVKKIDNEYKSEIKKYWEKYGIKVDFREFSFYSSRMKNKDVRYITKKIFHSNIEPYYNNLRLKEAFMDKNYLDLYLKGATLPFNIVRNINGVFLNNEFELLNQEQVLDLVLKEQDVVIKPTVESGGGRQIIFCDGNDKEKVKKEILEYINKNNKDYCIQRVIKQHDKFKSFNKTSVNTLRILSFLYNGGVHILYSVLRVGKEGSKLDNASAGGYEIAIDKSGMFTDYIVNINNEIVNKTNEKYKLKGKKVPFYDKIVKEIKRLHPMLAHYKLIGWDVTVDEEERPVIIEVNLEDIGMSNISQAVNGPLFGEMTDEVVLEVFAKRNEARK